ncbi:proline dehydrogenase family protein [Granulicella tundricola]|uniref:proline dehydrogenase n=1 Tax=Granulicella tundricola (strain ATCC BAA-1859 / DSM 23138 / MP5ACTX9) TaxID=1198114 RepID=E8WWE7_GRATM|nr:proline dehydrogenase family protein [Granulicella tundricola]ADW69611.1 Proline dehydrogenase [Granulicella tundricola MP5ACTX9]
MLRSFFISMSQNKSLRAFSEKSAVGKKLSSRFVAGMTVAAALEAAEQMNREGLAVSLDSLGESVMDEAHAHASAAIYHEVLDAIQQRGLNANVSVKLTQMGMDLDPSLAESIVAGMIIHAEEANTFVRIDMEGSEYTEATIQMTERLNARWPGRVGTVLQAYLYRTADDAQRLVEQGIRIRLCKGAYKEPAEIAFPEKSDVDENYERLMLYLSTSGVFCGMATHDETIIDTMRRFVEAKGLPKANFEFQMLYGIRRDLQRKLAAEGYGVRIYIPFGAEWYPYFMRRLAERPANVLFLAKNFFKR